MIVSQKFIDNMDIRKGRTIMKIEIKNLTKKIKGNTVLENVIILLKVEEYMDFMEETEVERQCF